MTHPTDQELLAFEDGELTAHRHRHVVGHLAECASCEDRLGNWRARELRTTALLSALDHRARGVTVDAVIARASASAAAEWRPLIAAGVALLLLAGAATAAVPGSALRRYLDGVIATSPFSIPRRSHSIPVAAPAARHAASGIAFVPGPTVDIAFREEQSTGAIRITLRDSEAVRLEHHAGRAGFTLTAAGVVVENTGSGASYLLLLPRDARQIIVRVGPHTVFARTHDNIATTAARDSSGSYVLAFTHLNRREP
jgi:hypothetical protein